MTGATSDPVETGKSSWRFPGTFWIANGAELFERAAFYGMFIALVVYLTDRVGFTDVEAGVVAGLFSAFLYFLPPFVGAMADKMGFRRAILLAFAVLAAGYGLLGAFQLKSTALISLSLIVFGGAIIKPTISGTAAKCSDGANRARAMSIFYMMVNIGSFFGKTVARPLRTGLGLEYINYYAALMAVCAFFLILFFYRNVDEKGTQRDPKEVLLGLFRVVRNVRFMCLIVIVAGFWLIQGQLYSSMTKYVLRLIGEQASPEWLANINPFVVVALVVPITHLIRRMKPSNAIAIGMAIIPLSALTVSLSPLVGSISGGMVRLGFGLEMHPITFVLIFGIAFQGLAECFLSPKYMEFASKQAPEGEVGLYMGYQNLSPSIAWFFGFIVGGYLLEAYCPDPKTLSPEVQALWKTAIETGGTLPEVYANAHYIWYVFAGIGLASFAAMLVFKLVTDRIDRRASVDRPENG